MMEAVKITIELPVALVERARAAGVDIEAKSDMFAETVEREIKRSEAARELMEIAEQLRALPDEDKPSLEEIDEAVRQARAEIAAEHAAHSA